MPKAITKYRYLVGLSLLNVVEPLGKGDQIIEGLRITNDKAVVRKFMTRDLMEALGGLESWNLLNADALIHFESEAEGDLKPAAALDVLTGMLHLTGMFLTALWLVKDNAVNFELGFMEVWPPTGDYRAHSNFLATTVQKADGSKPTTVFSRSELRQAREIFQNLIHPMSRWTAAEVQYAPGVRTGQQPVITFHASVPRLRRAFYFLESARSFRDMGMKIAMYCSLFETLFSTDASEITHKIAHRIAVFLESETVQRCDIYSRIKKAYGIRSKVVHGDEIKQDAKTIQAVAVDVDEIARRIFHKIGSSEALFDQFHASKSALDDYFLKESFGQ
ncbi:MAG: hypothetical protein D4R57_00385 [Verrucomicrobiales bacterium]|nr:MAG: hypothetical protein D4R57_00385 [Verrucomicrobiales bacterium]